MNRRHFIAALLLIIPIISSAPAWAAGSSARTVKRTVAAIVAGSAPAKKEPKAETRSEAFIEASLGGWIPASQTFQKNHMGGAEARLEGGILLGRFWTGEVSVVGGAQFSRHELNDALVATDTFFWFGYVGARYVPDAFKSRRGSFFITGLAGVAHESALPEEGHNPPKYQLCLDGGIGYLFHTGGNLKWGLRVDATYLEENDQRDFGWATPSAFVQMYF